MDTTRRRALVAALAGGVWGGVPTGVDGVPPEFRPILAIPRASPRPNWDRILTVEAPGIACDDLEIIALTDGRLIVDEDVPDGALTPFADASEKDVIPPYRVTAVRIEGDVWGFGVAHVVLLELGGVEGDACDISRVGDAVTMTVDGVETKVSPETHTALQPFEGDVALTAEWLEEDTWVASVWPL